VIASRYASTTHCTAWKDASNACVRLGRPTLAMLVPSEASSMDSDRLMRLPRGDVDMGNSLNEGNCHESTASPNMAEDAGVAVNTCTKRLMRTSYA